MRRSRVEVIEQLTAALDRLAATDVAALDDHVLREQVLDLVGVTNRVQAELARRVDVFDRRGLSEADGFRTAKGWLQAFGRLSGAAASRVVSAARVLRRLPTLAGVARAGDASAEQVQQVTRLAARIGVEPVAEVEATLAEAAGVLDPGRFATVCARVEAHVDPDGDDPAAQFDRRSLTLSRTGGAVLVRGQLDAAGGAALSAALDAVMTPPADGDERTPAQRRADALVELASRPLTTGALPTVAGQRPQVGVLLYPQALSPATLTHLADAQRDQTARRRLLQAITDTGTPTADWARPQVTLDRHEQIPAGLGRTSHRLHHCHAGDHTGNHAGDLTGGQATGATAGKPSPQAAQVEPKPATSGRARSESAEPGSHTPELGPGPRWDRPGWDRPGWAEPPWLSWHGPTTPAVAQRLACDADIWRVILDPATSQPLDVGRRHRLVPAWIRRALHARDRGCRWPGCPTPAEWTDAHHIIAWADGGPTNTDNCLLLCRHHHGLVHDGRWTITFDPATGNVTITRPNGRPYRLPGTESHHFPPPSPSPSPSSRPPSTR